MPTYVIAGIVARNFATDYEGTADAFRDPTQLSRVYHGIVVVLTTRGEQQAREGQLIIEHNHVRYRTVHHTKIGRVE